MLSLSRSCSLLIAVLAASGISFAGDSNSPGAPKDRNSKSRYKTVDAGGYAQIIYIDPGDGGGGGGGGGPVIYTAEVPVTFKGVALSGTIGFNEVSGYQAGAFKGWAAVEGSCGNANGYGYTVGYAWRNGNWAPTFPSSSCQYPDPNYCDTLARGGVSTDKAFYWPGYSNPGRPHIIYVTVDFGYNTDSKYWMYATTRDPLDANNLTGYDFGYWAKRSSGGGGGYRLGPYLLQQVPTGPYQAGVKTLYERASSYWFNAPYGSSCLRSVELYEAIPAGSLSQIYNFSINAGLQSADSVVDIPLWGLEGKSIDLGYINLSGINFDWVSEQKIVQVSISETNLNRLYGGNYDAWVQESAKTLNYEMPMYAQPSAKPVIQVNKYEIVYQGKYPHLRLSVTK